MKTFDQIFNEVLLEGKAAVGFGELVTKRYAQQVAEDVRRRCYENAEVDYRGQETQYPIEVVESSIMDTEIILP